jgi:hypothetical protein
LDRPETDFKTDELLARLNDGPEAPPKSLDLLRQGDELYERGDYQQAIHVWTRILFLERGNPEARHRIDRAKEAVAERQRKLDAEIAEARGHFDAGDIEAARASVRSVLAADAGHGEARQLGTAIEILDRRSEAPREGDVPAAEPAPFTKGVVIKVPRGSRPALPRAIRPKAPRFKMVAFVVGALLTFAAPAFYLSANWESIVSGEAFGHPPDLSTAVVPDRLAAPVPDLSRLRYYNGQRLFGEGRYREALVELRRVDRDSAIMAEARSLMLRIEDRLLRGPTGPEPAIDRAR